MITIQKPDIVETIAEHVDLKRAGQNFKGLCPFHAEKTPSFIVNPSRQTWHCFGEGRGGDVISFIQELQGLDFKGALKYLGISTGKPSPEMRRQIKEARQNRVLVERYEFWKRQAHMDACTTYREIQQNKKKAIAENDIEQFSELYHRESPVLFLIEILESNDEEAILSLYEAEILKECAA